MDCGASEYNVEGGPDPGNRDGSEKKPETLFLAVIILLCSSLFLAQSGKCVVMFQHGKVATKIQRVSQADYPLPEICLKYDKRLELAEVVNYIKIVTRGAGREYEKAKIYQSGDNVSQWQTNTLCRGSKRQHDRVKHIPPINMALALFFLQMFLTKSGNQK